MSEHKCQYMVWVFATAIKGKICNNYIGFVLKFRSNACSTSATPNKANTPGLHKALHHTTLPAVFRHHSLFRTKTVGTR